MSIADVREYWDRPAVATKVCTGCGSRHHATTEFFRARKRGKYGVSAKCLVCERAEGRERARSSRKANNCISRLSQEEIDQFWNGQPEPLIAYLAGLIDGEGCIYIGRSYAKAIVSRTTGSRQYLFLSVSVTSTTLPLMLWLKKNFGGSYRSKRPQQDNWRECYGWRLMSRQAAEMLRRTLPYLIVKKEQAEIALEFQERLFYGGRVTEEEMDERIALKGRLEALR